jgi:hypothetical protein
MHRSEYFYFDYIVIMEIKHACSLGPFCHSSNLLQNNNLKKCSYPFDWIFSNCDNVIHCIENDFNIFLDKSYYIEISGNKCGHKYYNDNMWLHHDPLNNKNDYNYYTRCVDRFKQLLKFEKLKLFIMIFVNMDNIEENQNNNIINFNNKFSKYTKNYKLLVIYHIKNKEGNHHSFTHRGNIDFLELHTISFSNGVKFINDADNKYLNTILNATYKFNIENTQLYTPLNIYNGTPFWRLNRDLRATLPINELQGNPPSEGCPILNLHRCKVIG